MVWHSWIETGGKIRLLVGNNRYKTSDLHQRSLYSHLVHNFALMCNHQSVLPLVKCKDGLYMPNQNLGENILYHLQPCGNGNILCSAPPCTVRSVHNQKLYQQTFLLLSLLFLCWKGVLCEVGVVFMTL